MQHAQQQATNDANTPDSGEWAYTTSAGICFGAPDDAADADWRDAAPAAACAADDAD